MEEIWYGGDANTDWTRTFSMKVSCMVTPAWGADFEEKGREDFCIHRRCGTVIALECKENHEAVCK